MICNMKVVAGPIRFLLACSIFAFAVLLLVLVPLAVAEAARAGCLMSACPVATSVLRGSQTHYAAQAR